MWIRYVQKQNNKGSKVILVICFYLFSLTLWGQGINNELYLISGKIYESNPEKDHSYLLRLDNQQLDTILVLSNDSAKFRFIKAYHNLGKVIILKDGYIYNNEYVLQIIPMDNPKEMNIEIELGDGNNLFEKYLIKYDDSLYYIFDNVGKIFGVNIDTYNKRIFNSPEILRNAFVKGVVGGLEEIKTYDYVLLGHNAIGDSIFISIDGENYYYNLKIPDTLISVKKTFYASHINNDKYMVIWNESSEYNSIKRLGWSKILIFEKKTQKWNELNLKGNIVNILNIGTWIAGWVTEGFDNSAGFYWKSPGESFRNSLLNSFFDERTSDLAVYMPGLST